MNGMVCGDSFGEIRVPHLGNVVENVIEGAYEVLGIFDRVADSRDEMKSIMLQPPEQYIFASAALEYKYDGQHVPVTSEDVLRIRRAEDQPNDLWTTYQRIQLW